MWQFDIYVATCETSVDLEMEDQGLNGFALNLHLQFHLLLLFATVPVLQPRPDLSPFPDHIKLSPKSAVSLHSLFS